MAPSARYRIEQPKLVFVEGNDDYRIFGALLRQMNLSDVQLQSLGGIDNLRSSLQALKGVGGFQELRSLAVVVDADTNRDARSDLVRGALSNAGLPVPSQPLQLASDGPLSVAYTIVPEEGQGTMMEDVCLSSVAGDPVMQCVNEYLQYLDGNSVSLRDGSWASKARAHAFLASRDRPGLRLGEAADSSVWPLDHGAFDPFRNLLTML